MPNKEKLTKGIESLEYRLAALAEKFSNSRNTDTDKAALDVSKQINLYGRSLAVLRGELELLNSKEPNVFRHQKSTTYTI